MEPTLTNQLYILCNCSENAFQEYNNTSYVLGKDGNLLPAGSGLRRPKAQPEVCQFHFPRAINSNLFLKHMKYYFYYMFFYQFICSKCYFYSCKRYLIEMVIHSLKPNDVWLFNDVTNVQTKKYFIFLLWSINLT